MNPALPRMKKKIKIRKVGLKVTIQNLQKKIPINPRSIKEAALGVFSAEAIKKSADVTICFVNDKKIKEFNVRYLAKNRPTDVIAFDITSADAPNNIFADIVISTDTATANSRIFKTSPLYEIYMYVVHGILHLLGYDDKNEEQRLRMEKRTKILLNKLNIKEICPYTEAK